MIIEIRLNKVNLNIKKGEHLKIKYIGCLKEDFKIKIDNQKFTLIEKANREWKFFRFLNIPTITIVLPLTYDISECYLDILNSNANISSIKTDILKSQTDGGNITLKRLECSICNLYSEMGIINFHGNIEKEGTFYCKMGKINCFQKRKDFSYEFDVKNGVVKILNKKYTNKIQSVVRSHKLYYKINCDMGNVTIS